MIILRSFIWILALFCYRLAWAWLGGAALKWANSGRSVLLTETLRLVNIYFLSSSFIIFSLVHRTSWSVNFKNREKKIYYKCFNLLHLKWVFIVAPEELRPLVPKEAKSFNNSLKLRPFLPTIVEKFSSKEIILKDLEYDFKPDFPLNYKTKLNVNNLNTPWKWWIVCMPRPRR